LAHHTEYIWRRRWSFGKAVQCLHVERR